MRRRLLLATAAAIGASSLTGRARGDERDPVDDAIARIAKARASIKTLQAPFEQTRVIGLLAAKVESKGKLTLVMPARLRWDLHPPDAVTYWLGPDGLAMKNEEGVTHISKSSATRFAAVLEDLLTLIGGDMSELRARYDFAVLPRDPGLSLRLTPKDARVKKQVKQLVVDADAAMLIDRVRIVEKNDDESVISFGDYTKNAKVDPKVMEPPKK